MLLQSGLMTGQLSSSRTSFLRVFITDTVAEKSVIYGRRRTRFIEGEKANFDAGLNCTTLQSRNLHQMKEIALKMQKSYPKRATSKENVAPGVHLGGSGVNPTVALQQLTRWSHYSCASL